MLSDINQDNFEAEVLKSEIPVLLDFWAPWCGPCMLLDPIMEELSEEYSGSVKICKINLDEGKNNEIAAHYNVTGLPTLKLFSAGQVAGEIIGAVRKEMVIAAIQKMLDNKAANLEEKQDGNTTNL